MRIAQVAPFLNGQGGIQTYIRQVSRALTELGHEVEIFALGSPDESNDAAESSLNIRWFKAEARESPLRYGGLANLDALVAALRSFDGLVHAHQPFASTTFAAIRSRQPRVLSAHVHAPGYRGGAREFRRRIQLRLVAAQFNGIVFDSDSERDVYSSLVGRSSMHVVARPGLSALSPTRLGSDARSEIAIVGALTAHKRPDLALRSAIEAGRGSDCRVVGQGPMRPALASLCEEAGLITDQVLCGSVDDATLADLMGRSKVILALSTEEAYGIGLADGIAAGAFPIAADIPSHREIFRMLGIPQSSLVPIDATVAAIAEKILFVLGGTSIPPALSSAPTWEDAATALQSLYQRVTQG